MGKQLEIPFKDNYYAMEYRYDIHQFFWNKETNTLYQDAWHLECFNPDGSLHPEAFPNQKGQFVIHNYKTGGFRRFRFVKETKNLSWNENNTQSETIDWIFVSEDGIICNIGVI